MKKASKIIIGFLTALLVVVAFIFLISSSDDYTPQLIGLLVLALVFALDIKETREERENDFSRIY